MLEAKKNRMEEKVKRFYNMCSISYTTNQGFPNFLRKGTKDKSNETYGRIMCGNCTA